MKCDKCGAIMFGFGIAVDRVGKHCCYLCRSDINQPKKEKPMLNKKEKVKLLSEAVTAMINLKTSEISISGKVPGYPSGYVQAAIGSMWGAFEYLANEFIADDGVAGD